MIEHSVETCYFRENIAYYPGCFRSFPQKIAEQKLQAFTVGTMGKRQLSRKELEEQKKREDEAAAAHVRESLSRLSSKLSFFDCF